MSRSYTVHPCGKKFATDCRTDGYWSITFLSKNIKMAKRKGDEFVSGHRTAVRKYTTPYGRYLNEVKSRNPKLNEAEIVAKVWANVNLCYPRE